LRWSFGTREQAEALVLGKIRKLFPQLMGEIFTDFVFLFVLKYDGSRIHTQ
jgi:hypothetical protein